MSDQDPKAGAEKTKDAEEAREAHDLEQATRSRRRGDGDGSFDLSIPDGWQQGRGAYGGLTIASLVRAAEAFANTPDRSLRSLTAELPAATMLGDAELRVEALRVGSGQGTYAARLVQDGEVRAHAVAVLARPRAPGSAEFCELEAPQLRPWREMDPLEMGQMVPIFTKHFEYRSDGPFPFTGGKEALSLGWIRARNPGTLTGGGYIAAMADAWWPSTFTRSNGPFALGTVAFTLQIVGALDRIDTALPLAYRARVWVQREGWFVEQRELWSEGGELIALNQQTFAIIK